MSCKEEQDTIEHVFQCMEIKRILRVKETKGRESESKDIKVLKKT